MKAVSYLFMVLLGASSASAASGALYYTEGELAGQEVKSSSYIGYYETCFAGNAYAAKNKLVKLMNNDIEKDGAFAKVDAKKDVIVFGYTDTKCLDEGATVSECRSVSIAARCR
ncbi:hypothetical protein [Bdellovibrio bacteriovorus]|uniref:hypothetical protein n=1 Tax=Bdellovibrio TaxID=958 RepID=UPI0035A823D2